MILLFEEFVKKLSDEFNRKLPGFSAQKLMAPLGNRHPNTFLNKNKSPKKSAVLLLLYPAINRKDIKTVFILRPENESGSHAGQISFPGGGYDETDIDLSGTALREAEEEIGVQRKTVSLVGALTPLYIPVSNYMVHPFVGMSKEIPEFKIHPLEVQELFECEIIELISEKNKGTILKHLKVINQEKAVPCYNINGKIIWGATAMIISELSEIINRNKI
ncbi:MAG: CoA pyrophosphatase [Bacteroidota bacterium]